MAIDLIRSPADMQRRMVSERAKGLRVGLVPTMGYLHEGHMSLLRLARAQCNLLVMSLFVNPTQFGKGEDLDRYPRDEEGDMAKARSCGVDLLFSPSAEQMYPKGFETRVSVGSLGESMCGASRPGHFDAVATVVTKLFTLCMPDVAVFGQKDFQQLAIIRRLVTDLNVAVEILGGPIIREQDGLAMSSRNLYLSEEQRKEARCLHRGLGAAKQLLEEGSADKTTLLAAADAVIGASALATIDYLELRDAKTLQPIKRVEAPAVMAVAAHFGRTRLIDNILLSP